MNKTVSGPLFLGTARDQKILFTIYRDGFASLAPCTSASRLLRSGIVAVVQWDNKRLTLDSRHPAANEVRRFLREILGEPAANANTGNNLKSAHRIDPLCPLAHTARVDFWILACLLEADGPLDLKTLAQRILDAWPQSVRRGVERLRRNGILTLKRSKVWFSEKVPDSYLALIRSLSRCVAVIDPRAANFPKRSGRRVAAFNRADDGAPRLFGTDVRLRNLMALAKHGALYVHDLRRITGTQQVALEERDYAPFGRGMFVYFWEAEEGPAVILHPQFVLLKPLKALLRRLEAQYPLPDLHRSRRPVPPKTAPQCGAQLPQLFSSEISTSILATLGVLGWTFEALCVETAPAGKYRENVKKAVKRLEGDGILRGDRPRRPGMNVRVLTVAEAFPAKPELERLLRAYAAASPQFVEKVKHAIEALHPKTRVHLEKRGIL